MSDTDSEPEVENLKEQGKLALKIQRSSDHSDEVIFHVKRDTTLGKVFKSYCSKLDVKPGTFKFHYDAKRLLENYTPKMLEWKLGKMYAIEAMTQQIEERKESEGKEARVGRITTGGERCLRSANERKSEVGRPHVKVAGKGENVPSLASPPTRLCLYLLVVHRKHHM
ncbi:hypothetical protein IAR55_003004 [Kwoniella newhampshirensis]|uniref:Rad60/SUMO-like domain-containing protein n=1 Tax=Kwoniella newhampshirensis TaxID=1651941 RepID=A0AAW0YP68_9TREE